MKDPLELFRAAVTALNEERWLDVADLCDPLTLQEFKRSTLAQLDSPFGHFWTVEDFLRHSPDMPREVAEYQLTQIHRQAHPDTRFARDFPSLSDVAQLRSLEPREVFASWLEGRSIRRQVELMVREGRISNTAISAHSEMMAAMKHRLIPIGALPDGDDLMHIVYSFGPVDSADEPAENSAPSDASPEELKLGRIMSRAYPLVTSCIRQPRGHWSLIADYNFLSMGSVSVDTEDGEID